VGDNLGYWGCMAVACDSGGRRPIPLHFRLWSADSPGFVSENDEVEREREMSLFEFFGLNTG